MQCMELWGGISETERSVAMTGLNAYLYSRPFEDGKTGGDVYYFSSCASGRISRILLADVTGHGDAVSGTADMLRRVMRRNVNTIRQTRLVQRMNNEFGEIAERGGFATSVVATFYAPRRTMSVSVAGHPPPLLHRAGESDWTVVDTKSARPLSGLPLGVMEGVTYDVFSVKFNPGDRLLLYTDAFYEALDRNGDLLKAEGLCETLKAVGDESPQKLLLHLRTELEKLRPGNLDRDDATAIVIEATGDSIPFANNLWAPMRLLGRIRESIVSR